MKYFAEVCLALFLILLFLPIFIVLYLLVNINMGKPVFFRQLRPGLHGDTFPMVKFRTMKNEINDNGILLSDEQRITKLGSFLRSSSLDELPALWNIVKGDMSFVGPRPLLVEYLSLYSDEQSQRHNVKPGITGWAQVNGRNAISWEDKFKLDVWYVDNRSVGLDVKIIFLTIGKVLKREGISQEGHSTMPLFMGSKR